MAPFDDFKRFVDDAQSGTQYSTWAAANCGGKGYSVKSPSVSSDLGKWYVYRDALLQGKRPAPPAMSTPRGRELVDAGVLYLDATPIVTPPPPALAVAFTLPDPISALVEWTAVVAGGVPAHVEFYIDGKLLTDEFAAPYTFNGDGGKFDPATVTKGTHTFEARAYDAAGKTYSRTQSVTVNPPVQPAAKVVVTGLAIQGQKLVGAIQ